MLDWIDLAVRPDQIVLFVRAAWSALAVLAVLTVPFVRAVVSVRTVPVEVATDPVEAASDPVAGLVEVACPVEPVAVPAEVASGPFGSVPFFLLIQFVLLQ